MSAMEKMVKGMLGAYGFDPAAVQGIIERRVGAFECNISILNKTLAAIHANQKAIMVHMNISEKFVSPDIAVESEKLMQLMSPQNVQMPQAMP